MVHVADAVDQGHCKIMIRTVDTDVVVIAVSCVQKLPQVKELWVHVGTGKNHNFIACHTIASALGLERAEVLPVFHAFTGCDTISSFNGRGKKSASEVWNVFSQSTRGFKLLLGGEINEAIKILRKCVITLYDRSSPCLTVNECRKFLFTKKDRQLENLPPTESALYQHTLRAVYQGVHVWGQALVAQQNLPSPSAWGWKRKEDQWIPHWTDNPAVASICQEFTRCRCKAGCKTRCNCKKRALKCTQLCLCGGNCFDNV